MLNTNSPRFVLMLIIMMVGLSLNSQTKEAVILYNTKPVLAEITLTGNVNKIIKDEPDFLDGFTLKVQDYGQFISSEPQITDGKTTTAVLMNVPESSDFLNIPFESGYATLSDDAITKLDKLVNYLKLNTGQKLIMRTLSKFADSALNTNRLNSIKTYLKIKGLSPDSIRFETLSGNVDVNEVKISFEK
ncbi:MAG: hypothetical protein IPL55_09025 [Saprospiraceae bacterium]|nr:hypothetical protein [Saprospiraceae bacterium]MBL0027173.1 hypothetical protein [Saprospiraceae bacterium]